MAEHDQKVARMQLIRMMNSGGPVFPTQNNLGLTIRDKAAMDFAVAQISFQGIEAMNAASLMRHAYELADAFVTEGKKWNELEKTIPSERKATKASQHDSD